MRMFRTFAQAIIKEKEQRLLMKLSTIEYKTSRVFFLNLLIKAVNVNTCGNTRWSNDGDGFQVL